MLSYVVLSRGGTIWARTRCRIPDWRRMWGFSPVSMPATLQRSPGSFSSASVSQGAA